MLLQTFQFDKQIYHSDMLTHSYKNNYDTAILVAGDNDFVSALQAVKDNGKHIEVALFGKEETSRELRRVADKVVPIDSRFLKDCWKTSNQPKKDRRRRTESSTRSRAKPQSKSKTEKTETEKSRVT